MEVEIVKLLTAIAIPYRRVEHPAVFTVEESKLHLEDKTPVKNLLLSEEKGDRLVLVIMSGDERLDTKTLANTLGCKKLQFAKSDVLLETLGVTPGSVSVFSVLNDTANKVEVVIDEKLVGEQEIGFHPNDNTITYFIPGHSIKTVLEIMNHTPRIMPL